MKKTIKENESYGLCYRCEHRANYHERGRQPRCECGSPEMSVHSCYMYKPVRPIKLTKSIQEDERPMFGPSMLSCRVKSEKIADGVLSVTEDNTLYWIPDDSTMGKLFKIKLKASKKNIAVGQLLGELVHKLNEEELKEIFKDVLYKVLKKDKLKDIMNA